MKRVLFLFALVGMDCVATASKCNPDPPTPIADAAPTPAPVVDAAPAPAAPSCATACARAAALGCDYASPSPKGVTCEAVCQNAQQFVPWNLACRTNITSCAAVLNCK